MKRDNDKAEQIYCRDGNYDTSRVYDPGNTYHRELSECAGICISFIKKESRAAFVAFFFLIACVRVTQREK